MRTFFKVLSAERLKMSKSPLWLIVLISPIIATLTGTLMVLEDSGSGMDLWTLAIQGMALPYGVFFLPIMAGLFSAFACRYEHTGGGWKQLLVLPVSRNSVYLAKFTTVVGLLAISQLLFLAGLLFICWFHALPAPIPWDQIATSLIGGWIACLPLVALQIGVSLSWASFAAPLALNVSLTIPNILIVNSEDIAPFYPWAQPLLAMIPKGPTDFGAFNLPIESLMITILGSFALFFAAGLIHFNRKEI